MLENPRYGRALEAQSKQSKQGFRDVFLDREYQTQTALNELGIKETTSPSEVPHVGTILMDPELIPGLRVPYAVEVLGMPHAGKTMMINRYLEELWTRKQRHQVALVTEGAASIIGKYGELRYSDPSLYAELAGIRTFTGYFKSLKDINLGVRVLLSDRGQVDRRVWRRAYSMQGKVNPEIMLWEGDYIEDFESTPVQVGAIIMLMVRPEESIGREGKTGPITNIGVLSLLYEQYWRLHWEILQGEVPYRVYTCIDAEKDSEEVYQRFRYAVDTALNVHNVYLASLARAFPEEFDRAIAESKKNPRRPTHTQRVLSKKLGTKGVLVVGGDDMKSEDEILKRPMVEVLRLK